MTAKNKVRGNTLEREVVNAFSVDGVEARRAWGSDGRALGHHEHVDVMVTKRIVVYDMTTHPITYGVEKNKELLIQCKRKKKLPDWLGFSEHVNAVVIREDRGKKYIIMELDKFIEDFFS